MTVALSLARRELGNTHPNPAVGCVIVRPDLNNRVVGRGWTQRGGRPHAEPHALAQAGDLAHGATAYVTLEPCCHHGKSPPCSDALIEAGIKRCVIATQDPYEHVSGQGITALRDAGIDVCVGVEEQAARQINAGFLRRVEHGRPLFTLKTATTLDGRIATASGDSQWITGVDARAQGHILRATHDAILSGIGTVLADNPQLTCRLAGLEERSPVRVVLDARLDMPLDNALVETAKNHRLIMIAAAGTKIAPTWTKCLRENANIAIETVQTDAHGRLDLQGVAALLGKAGLTRVLIEAGAELSASFIKAGLVDEIVWFRGPSIIGGDGLPAIADLAVQRLDDAPVFKQTGQRRAGPDTVSTYTPRHKSGADRT